MAGSDNLTPWTAALALIAGLLGFGVIIYETCSTKNPQKTEEKVEYRYECRYDSPDTQMSDKVKRLNERFKKECYQEEKYGLGNDTVIGRYDSLCVSKIEHEILGYDTHDLFARQNDKTKLVCESIEIKK